MRRVKENLKEGEMGLWEMDGVGGASYRGLAEEMQGGKEQEIMKWETEGEKRQR